MNRVYPIDEVIESLREEEGWSNTAYKCSEGHWTIGYGRNVDPHTGIGISREEGELMLTNDVRRTIEELENAFPKFRDLDQPRTAILIELCFQLGLPTLRKFTNMLAALWAGDNDRAAEELLDSRYARQVPARADRYAERLKS